jgi:SAM-dependent methyltransferase
LKIAITYARDNFGSGRISFYETDIFSRVNVFDFCYTNGVFHHIPRQQRLNVIQQIRQVLVPGGLFAFFENNP